MDESTDYMRNHIAGRLMAEVQREVEATFANLPAPTFEDCAADLARRLALLAGEGDDPAMQEGDGAARPFRTVFDECDANPSGVHGPLRDAYDPDMPEGFAAIECGACGLSTGIPIPEPQDISWG